MSNQEENTERRIVEVPSSALLIREERKKSPILSEIVSTALSIANNSLNDYPIIKKYIDDYYETKNRFILDQHELGSNFENMRKLIVEYKDILAIHLSNLNSVREHEIPELWRALGDAYFGPGLVAINPKEALPWLLKTAKHTGLNSDIKILSRLYSDEKSPYYDFEKAVHWMELTIGDSKISEETKIGNMMDLVDLYLTQSKNPLNRQKARELLQRLLPYSKRFKFYQRAQKLFNKLKAESEVSPN